MTLERELTTAACPAMRWRLGRNFWRHDRDEGFRVSDYSVDEIEDRDARAFVLAEHYSRSYPFAQARFGLFRGARLVGAAVFSTPISGTALARYCGAPSSDGLELGRFVLLDEVPYNAESHFLSAALRLLRRARPTLTSVIAYSDPIPRMDTDGRLILPGHIGIAYQATSGRYVGRSAPKMLHLTTGGLAVSSRALSKIRLQEHGAKSAERRFIEMGAPPRMHGESPRAWVQRALEEGPFRRVQHGGNHVYVWTLLKGAHRTRALQLQAPAVPYPKSLDHEQLGLF